MKPMTSHMTMLERKLEARVVELEAEVRTLRNVGVTQAERVEALERGIGEVIERWDAGDNPVNLMAVLDGLRMLAPRPSVCVAPCVGDVVTIRGEVAEVDENGDLNVRFAGIGSSRFRMWLNGEHVRPAAKATAPTVELPDGEYESRVADWRARIERVDPNRSAFEKRITEDAYHAGWADHAFAMHRATPTGSGAT